MDYQQRRTAPTLLRWVLLCAMLAVLGCEPANNNQNTNQAADEQLWLTPPKGWTLTANVADSARHVRYQDPTQPSQSLTIESRANATLGTPAADPLELLDQLAKTERQDCAKSEDFNTFTGYEQGFATAVRLFVCQPNDLTMGRLTLLKIIQGQQQTYLIALEHQWSKTLDKPPSGGAQGALGLAQNSNNITDRVAAWSLYMRGVRLCAVSGCEPQTN